MRSIRHSHRHVPLYIMATIYMSVALRDSKMKDILALASLHSRQIAEGFANMKDLAEKNPFLREVLEEHRKGIGETIGCLDVQKDALRRLVEYLDEKRDTGSAQGAEARVEAMRVMDEIKRIDKEIARLTHDFA